nr:globin-like [Rhipicephalus microplus]
MGNLTAKDTPDTQTGMTKREVKLVRQTWDTFCHKHPDFGSFVLLAMFTKHPHSQEVFPKFKGCEVRVLRGDTKFQTFGKSVGDHLAAIVNSVDNYEALVSMTRQNAKDHAKHEGVEANHFELFFSVLLTQMVESNKSAMTTAAVGAWEKVFQTLKTVTRQAFDEAAEDAKHSKQDQSTKSSQRHHKRHSSSAKAGAPKSLLPGEPRVSQ